jgi:hypothetical protein
MSKREVKIATVEMAISTLLNAEAEDTTEHGKQKLAEFLELPFRPPVSSW